MKEIFTSKKEKKLNPEIIDAAISAALDGYAKDSDTWLAAYHAFYAESEESQRRIDEEGATEKPLLAGLGVALHIAAEGAESPSSDAMGRFYEALNPPSAEEKSVDAAISAALDGYAKDSDIWLHAYGLFYQGLADGLSQQDALATALDAAKIEAESEPVEASQKYYATLHDTQSPSRLDREYVWESKRRNSDGSPLAALEVPRFTKKAIKLGVKAVGTVRGKKRNK